MSTSTCAMMANGLPYPVSHLCSEGASKGSLVPKDITPVPYSPRSLFVAWKHKVICQWGINTICQEAGLKTRQPSLPSLCCFFSRGLLYLCQEVLLSLEKKSKGIWLGKLGVWTLEVRVPHDYMWCGCVPVKTIFIISQHFVSVTWILCACHVLGQHVEAAGTIVYLVGQHSRRPKGGSCNFQLCWVDRVGAEWSGSPHTNSQHQLRN